ncbi:Na+/H+ antiporter NhaC [Halopelagius inordinatus]|uniref:Na+/H+ antiporter NhaC n=1 Tax=Halopelagius inordinatus TaxID=553467 RepID=A0A1I2UN77_9EURY|nr:Na+/H+ antiporter NhaC family protein [Halopelagius inordinatus]SFG78624.1 Na+/H+ antiporter NhaC [Halopelagius inordinatus]
MAAETHGLISLLPALLAIVLTLLSRQVLLSLFAGIWIGATILVGWNPIAGAAHSLQLVIDNITPAFNIKLLLFTFLSGAMLGMIFLSGGMNALAKRIIDRIRTRRQAEIGTSVLGMLIFVDSYASTMITGSVMRPITDQFDISREKLAYLLDSTTSPVVSVAVVSTWVGFEVGLISQQFQELGIETSAFVVFLQSIPYRFYSLLAVVLVFVVVFTGWNFGPMKRAEKRAKETGKVLRDDANPLLETREEDIVTPDHVDARWWYFALPIVTLVAVTGFGLLYSGGWPGRVPVEALKEAATADAILWGVFSACGVLLAILIGHARIGLDEVSDSIFEGFKMVMFPVAVLSLAWTIGAVSQALGVGPYVVAVSQGVITASLLPAVVFVSAAIISFSIGTSWGTMGIMFPVAVPLAFNLGAPLPGAIGAILTGSLFGDHCSPISDTTVMSSMFAGSDHVDHVNTQIPYAVVCGSVATLLFLASGYGISPLPLLAVGIVLVAVAAYTFSERTGVSVPRVFSSDAD